jgi:hypothetical protein
MISEYIRPKFAGRRESVMSNDKSINNSTKKNPKLSSRRKKSWRKEHLLDLKSIRNSAAQSGDEQSESQSHRAPMTPQRTRGKKSRFAGAKKDFFIGRPDSPVRMSRGREEFASESGSEDELPQKARHLKFTPLASKKPKKSKLTRGMSTIAPKPALKPRTSQINFRVHNQEGTLDISFLDFSVSLPLTLRTWTTGDSGMPQSTT